jgi:hypothetical protein
MDVSPPSRPAVPPAAPPKPAVEAVSATPPAVPVTQVVAQDSSPEEPRTTALPVHEAPAEDASDAPSGEPAAGQSTPSGLPDEPAHESQAAEAPAEPDVPAPAPRQKAKDASPLPVGAIIAALFFMIILAAITVMVYVQS